MLMEHFLCDDAGGKNNVCGMVIFATMSDVHTKKVRSFNMSQIKGKNTKPEVLTRKFLHANGFRFKLHDKKLPGKPDIVLPKYKTVIEIQGCFWHGHTNCKYFVLPKSNKVFWRNKISDNIKRDIDNEIKIKELGWNLIIIWECELKNEKMDATLKSLIDKLRNG